MMLQVTSQYICITMLEQRQDSQIDVGCQSPVQVEFVTARLEPFCRGGKIKKTEIQRLFYFIGKRSGQKNP